ncbi:hypothetical protein Kpol_1043p16 [Vanderwaltozyma polyspora DSM 70294]|uniref:UDP-N-acetylglucosamine diphosphorylase n=1 Tax=Vanderwaltozyma polyspora (strain ATCC 22028 / DSM 70294 / BCRC 21397 / CBS 2163 / NBRC 10782 / NRRL Y-8283 / UCD 57-17) TaxID=436907 RepID=A7TIN4_VANPO|nr:uncharacterized protein Kpol_1043p16 [Vanderwaltozyma polyspora DSM 70294]EDO17826.1 hypothetical protein Kpol_1043p16 [Vanderwaltozyma polyspora DSM 70294]
MMTVVDIREKYISANQGHLFGHFDGLGADEQDELIHDLSSVAQRVEPTKLVKDCKDAIQLSKANGSNKGSIEPLPSSSYHSIIGNESAEREYWDLGMKAISNGEVAVILMAGGQGTRLGSSLPKGCYDIGLPSHKSLFQIQAEKLIRLQNLAGTNNSIQIPWYIMTSEPTRKSTEAFFKENSYFGLEASQIMFFNQGTLPAFDLNGEKLLLSSPTRLVQSPDGNGGLYRAIKDNNILQNFEKRNIKHVYMYCVDNVLSKVADPVFIGFAIKYGFELATKAVRKRDATESVGLIATKDSKPCVIEYSEISKELSEAKDDQGLLKLRAANIVNHYYSVDLLKKSLDSWCGDMSYHIAKKKIPMYDNATGKYIKTEEANGIKLEQFIFDVFPTVPLDKFGCLEVERSKEFSPLKNAPGSKNDTPETSRSSYLELGSSWLKDSGAILKENVLVEVSGKISYAGENLEQYKGKMFDSEGAILE